MAGRMNTPYDRKVGTCSAMRKYAPGTLAVILPAFLSVILPIILSGLMPAMAELDTASKASPPPSILMEPEVPIEPEIVVEPSSQLFIPRGALEDWARQFVGTAQSKGQFVGAGFALIRPEGPVLSRGFGLVDNEAEDTVHPGITWFPASGIGNLLVAQMLVELEAKNRLKLDDPVDTYLTRLSLSPDHSRLSIRDLFGNDTGLTTSLRGSHLYKDHTGNIGLGHIRALLRRSAIEPPADTHASPLAAALASIVAEDINAKPVQSTLEEELKARWNAAPWFNTAGAPSAKYISRDHRILPDGDIRRAPLHAVAPGFEASRGLYLTINDMAYILASQLTGLGEDSQITRDVVNLAFQKSTAQTTANGQQSIVEVLEIRGDVGANSLHGILVPDMDIGFLALVNSSARRPGLTQSRTGGEAVPVLNASNLVDSFITRFMPLSKPASPLSMPGSNTTAPIDHTGSKYANNADSSLALTSGLKASKSRPAATTKPLFQRSSVSGLTALFLLSVVFQFALLASARWEATTTGQRISKGLGMASVVFMTSTLAFPVVLVLLEHSETLVDPLFLISQWSFPVAALLALATMGACLIGWKNHFWGDERAGFHKRLCFTVGSIGVLGLAIVTWQLDLIIPVF